MATKAAKTAKTTRMTKAEKTMYDSLVKFGLTHKEAVRGAKKKWLGPEPEDKTTAPKKAAKRTVGSAQQTATETNDKIASLVTKVVGANKNLIDTLADLGLSPKEAGATASRMTKGAIGVYVAKLEHDITNATAAKKPAKKAAKDKK